ncbi:MAG: hypothetical protein IT374_11235 [Polyangiaceae bacterium]|nr:hypothetical protein [Polyangiaceae bacterium]
MRLGSLSSLLVVLALAPVAGCATYQDDLTRGIKYYEGNEHERSLAVLRSLEPDIDSLRPDDRVRYYYFRGMTDYRLANDTFKVRPDARHWLGLAAAGEKETPAALTEDQKSRLTEALDDLNHDIYGGADTDDAPKKDAVDGDKKAKKRKADADADADEPKKKKKKADD